MVHFDRFAVKFSTMAIEREVKIQPLAADVPDLSLLLLPAISASRTAEISR
ncbi:MAG TPA: hypothetical protein VGR61_09075 [Candidatus Dormibacteraeota bacterium]|nr:hypothetical protein [Candidatus Dormibacteraeota bacterium]